MADIQLNFINNSNDNNNTQIVIFQRNGVDSFTETELVVAWKLIENCGQGDNHPFTFPLQVTLSCSDSYGNFTPQVPVSNGDRWAMQMTPSGDKLVYIDNNGPADEVQVLNKLSTGSMNAYIFRDGRLLAVKTNVVPGQMADFRFKPTIYIGAVNNVVEGEIMDAATMSTINTEMSLLGIQSADIVMTGGGGGSTATPYIFSLQNVKYA